MLIPACLFAKTSGSNGVVLVGGNQTIVGVKDFIATPTINSVPVDTITSVNDKVSALDSVYALKNGSSTQVFNIAVATSSAHAATYGQITGQISAINNSKAYAGKYWDTIVEEANIGFRYNFEPLTYDNKMWLIGGKDIFGVAKTESWYSTNGVVWTLATNTVAFGVRTGFQAINYNGKMWIMGGYQGATKQSDVWNSTDGITWNIATTTAAFGARALLQSNVHDGKMWVIGGIDSTGTYKADSWYSVDGVTWTLATDTIACTARAGANCLSYANKLWLIGGQTNNGGVVVESDCWYSADGITWTLATNTIAIGQSNNAGACVYKGKMWVAGGYGYKNKAWYSTDGITWSPSEDIYNNGKGGVIYCRLLVYDNAIWEINGAQSSGMLTSTFVVHRSGED